MKIKLFFLAALLFPSVFFANLASAQSNEVIIGYANFSPTYASVRVAKEIGFFDKYNVNAEIIFIRGGAMGTQALVSRSFDFIVAGGVAASEAGLAGAEIVIVAVPSNRMDQVFVARTAGRAKVPELWSVDWVLGQFGKHRRTAQKRYRAFVSDGLAKRPWQELKGQVYLGSQMFVERHSAAGKQLKEIPRAQLKAAKPTLDWIFAKNKEAGIAQAYREHGYRLHEIAKHLAVHYATVSRRLKQLEESR